MKPITPDPAPSIPLHCAPRPGALRQTHYGKLNNKFPPDGHESRILDYTDKIQRRGYETRGISIFGDGE